MHCREVAHPLFERSHLRVERRTRRKPARLVEQLPNGDPSAVARIRHAEPGQIPLDGCVEVKRTALAQLHDAERRERFALRTDDKGRVGGDRTSTTVCRAEPLDVYNLIA